MHTVHGHEDVVGDLVHHRVWASPTGSVEVTWYITGCGRVTLYFPWCVRVTLDQ